MAVFAGDSLWYDAVVSEVNPKGYEVTFAKFGNTETIAKTHVKAKVAALRPPLT